MSGLRFHITGAAVLRTSGLSDAPLGVADGRMSEAREGREIDLSGMLVLPGIVDIHGDGFERHLAPRRGAVKDLSAGLRAAEAELAANGITTAVLAQFYSWEGGLRGPEFAQRFFAALKGVRGEVVTDLQAQLRFEMNMLEDYTAVEELIESQEIGYVVFNDHLPHERLSAGKTPPRLTGQALKAKRSPEAHLALLQRLHAQQGAVRAAMPEFAARLVAKGVRLGSHDDASSDVRGFWRSLGVTISEFPETAEAAAAAQEHGDSVILGAPNVVRGNSHKGNASAAEIIAKRHCTALASDYHYPSLHQAAFQLVDAGVDLIDAWRLISSGPAQMLGLDDRGKLEAGKRADLVILEAETRRIVATIAAGRISFLSGDIAERFIG